MCLRLCLAALCVALLGVPARASVYLRYVPSDTRAVYVVNVSSLGDLEQKLSEEIVRQLYLTQLVPELKSLNKVPITDLKQMIATQSHAGEAKGIVLLRGKVDAALFEKQMREAVKQSKGAMKVESVGKPAAPVFSRKVDQKALEGIFPALDRLPGWFRKLLLPRMVHAAALDDETLIVSLAGRDPIDRALRSRPAKSPARVS